jgi:hypothetical protein
MRAAPLKVPRVPVHISANGTYYSPNLTADLYKIP